jgi:hypothetical protein
MRGPLIVAALCVLAACGQKEKPAEAPSAAEAVEPNFTIGADGAAGITQALPLTLEAVGGAALGYVAAEATAQIEGESYPMITLSSGGAVVFNVLPTSDHRSIHAITTRSAVARGPSGEVVGESTFGQAPAVQVMFCAAESVDGGPGFSCSDVQDGYFWRVYALPPGYDGPSDPFESIDPDMAIEAKLAEMRWIAPRVETQ